MRTFSRLAVLVVVGGCAHGSGSSAQLAARPHAPLELVGPSGLPDAQADILEGSLCQAMVEVNHGDVACPSSTRAARDLQRTRVLASGDVSLVNDAPTQAAPAHRVTAVVSQVATDWILELSYSDSSDGKPLATRKLSATSFDELVQKAPQATRSLLE